MGAPLYTELDPKKQLPSLTRLIGHAVTGNNTFRGTLDPRGAVTGAKGPASHRRSSCPNFPGGYIKGIRVSEPYRHRCYSAFPCGGSYIRALSAPLLQRLPRPGCVKHVGERTRRRAPYHPTRFIRLSTSASLIRFSCSLFRIAALPIFSSRTSAPAGLNRKS